MKKKIEEKHQKFENAMEKKLEELFMLWEKMK